MKYQETNKNYKTGFYFEMFEPNCKHGDGSPVVTQRYWHRTFSGAHGHHEDTPGHLPSGVYDIAKEEYVSNEDLMDFSINNM